MSWRKKQTRLCNNPLSVAFVAPPDADDVQHGPRTLVAARCRDRLPPPTMALGNVRPGAVQVSGEGKTCCGTYVDCGPWC